MFTKKLEDQFSADLLNTVRGILGEAKHDKECECEKCEKEEDDDEDEDEKEEMKEGKRGLWDNIHAKRKRIKAGSGERMRKPGSKGAPTDADFRAASEEVELEEGKMKELITKHMDAGHDYDAAMKKAKKDLEKMKEEFEQTDILEGGYRSRLAQRNKDTRAQWIDNRNRELKAKNKEQDTNKLTKEEAEQIDELSKATMGRYINKAATKMGSQGVTAGLKIAADEKSSKNFKDMGKREKGIKLAVNKLTKEEQDFIDALNDAGVEQIDELSGATLGSYMVKSKKDETARRERGIKVRDEIRKQTGMNVGTPIDRKLYSPTASRGAGQKTAMKKLTGQARVNAKEEFELEEGRGRPPKEGSAAWKARQGKADDDMVALGMQLRKAQSINKKVRFMDSKEHDIHPNHINRFNDHMAARKTSQEKAAFQKQAHKSHADFVKAVSAPVPKAAKDTGEIVKYRH